MKSRYLNFFSMLDGLIRSFLILALLLLQFTVPFSPASAAASSQTTHSYLCAPDPASGSVGPRRVTNPNTNNTYPLNASGCAVIAAADIGYFTSQGYTGGFGLFTLQATALSGGASGTAAVSTGQILPAYAYIVGVVLCETAGNAVTGGLDIGDAGSITRFASAVTLGANACVTLVDTALTRIYVTGGVPTASAIQVAAHAAGSWNSASVNITMLYTFF